jgi:hypothetical protein
VRGSHRDQSTKSFDLACQMIWANSLESIALGIRTNNMIAQCPKNELQESESINEGVFSQFQILTLFPK